MLNINCRAVDCQPLRLQSRYRVRGCVDLDAETSPPLKRRIARNCVQRTMKNGRSLKAVKMSASLALLVLSAAGLAAAQDYPSRPITLIVPYAAGGGNDLMARIAAEKMSKLSASMSSSRIAAAREAASPLARSPRPSPMATRSASAAPARSPSTRRCTATSDTIRARTLRPSASSPAAHWSCAFTRRSLRIPLPI